jgi:hypothetical protein
MKAAPGGLYHRHLGRDPQKQLAQCQLKQGGGGTGIPVTFSTAISWGVDWKTSTNV